MDSGTEGGVMTRWAHRALPPTTLDGPPETTAYAASFRGMAEAFAEIAERDEDLVAALSGWAADTEVPALIFAYRSLITSLCQRTGVTPRSLLEVELALTPRDELSLAPRRATGATAEVRYLRQRNSASAPSPPSGARSAGLT
jgi:hypothetical protein